MLKLSAKMKSADCKLPERLKSDEKDDAHEVQEDITDGSNLPSHGRREAHLWRYHERGTAHQIDATPRSKTVTAPTSTKQRGAARWTMHAHGQDIVNSKTHAVCKAA